jgi:DNA invertase Pin-like site-specific DNA recombinase
MQGEIHNVQNGDSAGGQPPYGLKLVNKQYEIDEDEAPAIRQIFSMIAKRKQL